MRKFNVKVPFIGFDVVQVEIENDHDFESETELKECAEELAKDIVFDKRMCEFERLEFFKYVEGSNSHRYKDLIFEGFIEEIETIE